MAASIDLKHTHLHRNIGDLIIIYCWVNDERAMVLIPARRQKAPWYIVLDSAAWKYDEPEYLAKQCKIACEVLGMRPVPENWVKIAGIINDGLPDLITMPPAPLVEQMKTNMGRVELRADGETVAETDFKLDKELVTYERG